VGLGLNSRFPYKIECLTVRMNVSSCLFILSDEEVMDEEIVSLRQTIFNLREAVQNAVQKSEVNLPIKNLKTNDNV